MSLLNGVTMARAPLAGNRLGTSALNGCSNTAMLVCVPTAISMAKILSRLMSLFAAAMARGI